jgi:hypothetical protein
MRFDWFEKTNKGDTSNEGRWGTFLKWIDTSLRTLANPILLIYTSAPRVSRRVFHVESLFVSGCIPG